MTELLDAVMGQLGGDRLSQIANAIGADEAATQKGIQSALPALLGGLAANAAKPDGAEALDRALERHDGSVFDNLTGVMADRTEGNKIVKHVLGDKETGVANALAGTSGLSAGSLAKLLPMLAPLLMGVLGQKKKSGDIDLDGLGSLLGKESDSAQSAMPDLGDIFGMLTGGGSGSNPLDSLSGVLGGGSSSSKKGGLGSIFGKLFGKK